MESAWMFLQDRTQARPAASAPARAAPSAALEAVWVRSVWSPQSLGYQLPIGHCLPPFSIESILFSQFVQLNM